MKALANMERIQISNEVMLLLLSLYESKGKSFYYDDLFNRDLYAFEKKTMENNLVSLAHLLDLKMTDARIKLFAKKPMAARTKDEFLLSNLKTALTQLHKGPENFELLVNEVGNLIKLLSKNTDSISFNTYEKQEEGVLKLKKASKKDDLEKLIQLFEKNLRSKKHELTQLIANFYVDFLNMDILSKHNDLVALILLYALLARDFNVFKYVSFFKYFLKDKDGWKSGIITATYYWSSGFAQTDMLSRMLVNLMIKAYEEVDEMAHEYVFERELNKSNNIENSILKLEEIFTKEEIRKRHPNVSDATIDRTLKRLKDEDKIRPLGKGRSSKWQRIISGTKKYGMEQLTLFND
ncbi:MAG TPA: hypothetical protein DEG42_02070 [Acholeplasmataceae bacterium]|nr:MAG: hypothetical protein A2Y43_01490 [Tenericutes bacterium GWA2_38_26]OHE31139.1 MAG: hypothetical protein A2084_04020 [Tenericutes bacterium GWC2_39_45]OHE32362.1 MAG: hypothetical protein A2009_00155 [Tenericutes bacterium GWD2_38_27]OHE38802.1 MAG: hypothetical protein A2013_02380 [Tenericutes bacterium GWE2_38_8]OHE43029.1 MAG: hypothetical protein A2102_03475 [Tenericutes bacterium GWF2_38_8]HBY65169.1 hypothetical protein [Acholeplasmataceae bacterium]